MTAPALHSWSHFVQGELSSESRCRSVTPKAAQLVVAVHESPGSFVHVSWGRALGAQCGSESIQLLKKADAALIELAAFLQNVSLANGGTRSHRPADGHGDGLNTIRNRIAALSALSLNSIRVPAHVHSKHRMIDENFAFSNS